jgi:hypothetical protein
MTEVDYTFACDLCDRKNLSQTGIYMHLLRTHKGQPERIKRMYCYMFSMRRSIGGAYDSRAGSKTAKIGGQTK